MQSFFHCSLQFDFGPAKTSQFVWRRYDWLISVYPLHKDNIKHQKTIFSCFLKIGQSGLTKAFVAKNFAIFDQ